MTRESFIKNLILETKPKHQKALTQGSSYLYFVFEDKKGHEVARSYDDLCYSYDDLLSEMDDQEIDWNDVHSVCFEIWIDQDFENPSGMDELFYQIYIEDVDSEMNKNNHNMERKVYNVHLSAYYTADVLVRASSEEKAKEYAETYLSDTAHWEYADNGDSDVWVANDYNEENVYVAEEEDELTPESSYVVSTTVDDATKVATALMYFAYNQYSESKSVEMFGENLGHHIWSKFIGYDRDFAKLYADVDTDCKTTFVKYAMDKYLKK